MAYKSIRTLIASQNRQTLDIIKESLRKSEVAFKVDVVGDPDECLGKATANGYDVVLLDYDFPGRGLELLKAFSEKKTEVPVIMITSGHGEQAATESLKHGAFDYIKEISGYQEALPFLLESTMQKFQALRQRSALEKAQREATKRIRNLQAFADNIVTSLPYALLVLDHNFNVVYVNADYCKEIELPRAEMMNKSLYEIFPDYFMEEEGLAEALHEVVATGNQSRLTGIRLILPSNAERIFNVRVSQMVGTDPPEILLSIDDVTEKARRIQQLTMLQQIGRAMQSTLELDRLFFLILTCTTAGKALGFNRALLLLVNKQDGVLRGEMAVGPRNQEEALRVWAELSRESMTLKDFLDEYDRLPGPEGLPLYKMVKQIEISLNRENEILSSAVRHREAFVVVDAEHDERVDRNFFKILRSTQFVAVPLVTKNEVFGVIVADNLYNRQVINEEVVQLLRMLATQAGLAIENAEAYKKLKDKMDQLTETQGRLIRSEKLAAVGTMAAHVAHEIRNPLVTIGGFARSIAKSKNDDGRAQRSAAIIVEEVSRLEKILGGVMDFSKPSTPVLRKSDINELITSVCDIKKNELDEAGVMLITDLCADIQKIKIDPNQMRQVLINLIQNATEAMPKGGTLRIATILAKDEIHITVTDTGVGIPEDIQLKVFTPFFTTKSIGTGLGMAVCKTIIESHGGNLTISSIVNEGTTFTIALPFEQ